MNKISNKKWYKFWEIMAIISGIYLLFSVMPPTILLGVYIGVICLLMSLVFMWVAKRRLKNENP